MMHITVPARVVECAMSLHDSYSKACMLPLGKECTAPWVWVLLYGTWGILTLCDFHLRSPMEDETALRTFLKQLRAWTPFEHPPFLALVPSVKGSHLKYHGIMAISLPGIWECYGPALNHGFQNIRGRFIHKILKL